MPEFDVYIGMKIGDAVDMWDAAEQAHFILQEPGTRWLCEVIDCKTKESKHIDLDRTDELLGQRRPTSDEEDEYREMDAMNNGS